MNCPIFTFGKTKKKGGKANIVYMSMSGRRPTRHIHGDVSLHQEKEKNDNSSFD